MAAGVTLLIGTKKGLFTASSNAERDRWDIGGPFLNGAEINHAMVDPRDGRLYATANDAWFGSFVQWSPDMGKTWQDAPTAPRFAEEDGRKVERLWRLQPGRASQPGMLFCGIDPGGLFSSEDGGQTWQENTALGSHSTRDNWFPGAGGLITHSIVLDPKNDQRMWIAISAAGVFRSEDGGASWQPANDHLKNVANQFDPNIPLFSEVGQCVHHLVHAGGDNDRLYAQTHWGTYRSDDGARTWTEITEGLPSDFGFVIAAHPHNADVAYVLPLQGAEFRAPPEGKLRVYRTSDAGATWEPLSNGLPQDHAYMGTYREGMTIDTMDTPGVYFGTNTGQVYASANAGDSWKLVTADLPPISSLHAVVNT